MLSAEELYRRGVASANDGRLAAASRALDEAARRDPDADTRALIAGTRSYLLAERGDAVAAFELCRNALDAPGLSDRTRAVLAGQLGLVALRRGETVAALPYLDAAVDGLDAEPRRLGQVLLNRGMLVMERGRMREAGTDFERARRAFARAGDPVGAAKATHNRGLVALAAGDLVAALRSMDAARETLAGLSPVALATCDRDRADVLLAAGMPVDATGLLTAAAARFGSAGLRQPQAEAELMLARTQLLVDPHAAAVTARRAARRFRRGGSENWALRADAVECTLRLGAIGPRTRSAPTLLRRAMELVGCFDEAGLDTEATSLRYEIARASALAGDTAAADEMLDALSATSGAPVLLRILDREVRAEVAARSGRRAEALRHARAGLDAVRRWQASFDSLELRTSLALHSRRLLLTGLGEALEDGSPARVLDWSERTRAVVGRVARVRSEAEHVDTGASETADLDAVRHADPDALPALRAEVRRHGWTSRAAPVAQRRSRPAELRAALARDGATLLAFVRTEERLAVVVRTPASARLVPLGGWREVESLLAGLLAELDLSAATLPAALAASVADSLTLRLNRLSALLLDPLGPLSGSRLVITAPPALVGLPWSLLPPLRGRAVTVPLTAASWVRDAAVPWPRDRAGFVAGPGLSHADHEVLGASAAWSDARLLQGADATAHAVSALAASVDVLHIAAHGRHSAENPLFSGFELVDGTWFGHDIDRLPSVPALVLLSACELGRSSARWGQETLGMATAWLHAGVRCVIAAPARLDDARAGSVLVGIHAALAAGAAPAEALADVELPFISFGSGW